MKKFLLVIMLMLIFAPASFAEKIAIKITPMQLISTHNNELEVGDWVKFKVVNDVFYKNKLFIKKDTQLVGVIDSIHENGFVADNAEIIFQTFYVRNVNNELVKFNYRLYIGRKNSDSKTLGDKFIKYVAVILRGNEIKVLPESIQYNIFMAK